MKPFVEYVVKALVDYPDQVDIRENQTERLLVYELRLNKSDIGKVIGKQGRTIQALRTLAGTAGAKMGKRAMVEIIEDPVPTESSLSTEAPPPNGTTPESHPPA